MTVSEILEQVQALSAEERKELAEHLMAMIDISVAHNLQNNDANQDTHWGQSLNELLNESDPILMYPEIEDPVEWVQHMREEERKRRLGDWGDIE